MDSSILPYHAVNSQMRAHPNSLATAIKIGSYATAASGSLVLLASEAVKTFVDHHVSAVSNNVRSYAKGLYDGFTTPANNRPRKQAKAGSVARSVGEKRSRQVNDGAGNVVSRDRRGTAYVTKTRKRNIRRGRKVGVRKVNNLRRKKFY